MVCPENLFQQGGGSEVLCHARYKRISFIFPFVTIQWQYFLHMEQVFISSEDIALDISLWPSETRTLHKNYGIDEALTKARSLQQYIYTIRRIIITEF